jgi:hypothetical protein
MDTKAKYQADHEENRSKVCAVCGTKISFGTSRPSKFVINKELESLILEYSNNRFNALNSCFPKGICTSCKIVLYEKKRGVDNRNLPPMPNYLGSELSKESCSHDDHPCCCYICQTGRQKYHLKKSLKKTPTKNPALKVCNVCYSEIARGKQHRCSKNAVHKNMATTISALSEKTKDNIIHNLLATKVKVCDPSSNLQNVSMNLKTGGRDALVTLNPRQSKPIIFTEEKLDNLLTNAGSLKNIFNNYS